MKRPILIALVILLLSSFALAQDFCKGDFTYDGDVDAFDIAEFLNHFGGATTTHPVHSTGLLQYPENRANI